MFKMERVVSKLVGNKCKLKRLDSLVGYVLIVEDLVGLDHD